MYKENEANMRLAEVQMLLDHFCQCEICKRCRDYLSRRHNELSNYILELNKMKQHVHTDTPE